MNQGSDAGVIVEADGVSVEKRFTADEFPVPAVRFTLRSERETPAEFRLVDHVPEGVPMDHIGFHPEYDNDGWTAYEDHRVEYRRRLDPGEELTTVYGVRTDDPDAGEKFSTEPTVEEVDEDDDPLGGVAEVIGEDSSQAVRDVLSGDRETVPGGDVAVEGGAVPAPDASGFDDGSPEGTAGDDPTAPADERDADDASGTTGATDADTGGDDAGAAGEADADASRPGQTPNPDPEATGVAAALAAELRAGTVDPADRETLRRELEVEADFDAEPPASVDARIARLQSNVEDLAAYTDALEEFLDDNGTAADLAEDLRGEVDDLRETVSAVEADAAAADEERSDLEAGLRDVRDDVETVDEELSAATDGLAAGVDDVRDDLDDLATEVRADDDAVADVREDVADLRADVGALSDRLDDETDAIRSDLGDVREELREFAAFRDRLSSAFGAAGEGAPGAGGDQTDPEE